MWKDPRLWWTARSGSRGDLIVKDQLQRCAPRLHGSTPGSPTVRQLRCCGTVFQTGPAEEKREVETERESEKEREGKKRMGGRKRRMWQLLDADRVCAAGYTAFGEASALAPVPLRLRDQAQFGRERRSFIYQAGRTAAEAHTHSLTLSLTHTRTVLYAHTHTQGRKATWLHPTIWIFCPIWWWRAACSFPGTECELFGSSSRPPVACGCVCLCMLSWKAAVRCGNVALLLDVWPESGSEWRLEPVWLYLCVIVLVMACCY